ncbi:MAG: pyrimidine-nucleoside phosphorylase [Clostridiales bacterium]|nr:pyrimidine-nucleoside phosphorylase [Clostridiales bacterium]
MKMYDIIEKKRDKGELTYEEIKYFVDNYCDNKIFDDQAAALVMAMFLNGMTDEETANLTKIMSESGDMIDLSSIKGIKVDKHSTGGVGDKTTLILGPIVAALGVPVAKMSGKGLGHTGGTIDKLESIPNFNTGLSIDTFINNIKDISIAIAGQTGNLVPADKKLYSLRDLTATVNSIPLIASSIMSKKIASGADKIVLDVKVGNGAFMKDQESAEKLARAMVNIGSRVGRNTVAYITRMDRPLGKAVGNSLEVIEAIETLRGKGPSDLEEISYTLAAKMLELAHVGTFKECYDKVLDVVKSGKALKKLRELIDKQNGDSRVIDDYSLFKKAKICQEIKANMRGYVKSIDTRAVGRASMILGAGRETKLSIIDHSAGMVLNKKVGDRVEPGDVLATIYTDKDNEVEIAKNVIVGAYTYQDKKPDEDKLILAYIEKNN